MGPYIRAKYGFGSFRSIQNTGKDYTRWENKWDNKANWKFPSVLWVTSRDKGDIT